MELRIPEIDKLMEEHSNKHMKIVSKDNTPEEKKILKELDETLNKNINYVNNVINEVLDVLRARGCDVSKYI
tara:strand:+ start:834 stop:1049 length:216 start_codon:yes stop_codon:yes gene_type:complete